LSAGVSLERRDDVAVLRLGDGENRFDRTLVDDLNRALDEVLRQGRVGLVSVGSARFYSNGYDLEWLAGLSRDTRRDFIRDQQALLARWLVLPVPTAAALSGHAFGAGALLALAHDLRVAREDHGRWCLPEIDAGIPLRRGMTALVQARLSPRTARDALLGGRRYGAAEAVACGIADTSAPAAELVERACAVVRARVAGASRDLGARKRALYADAFAWLSGEAKRASPHPR